MLIVLADNLFTVAGILSPAECVAMIERGESIGFEPASVRTLGGRQMRNDIRDNDRAEFDDPTFAAMLWERCRPFVPDELESGTAIGFDTNFRFYRYDPGQRFERHRDRIVKRSPTVRTRLTCLVYLNDDFGGGETTFYGERTTGLDRPELVRVTPVAGMALFFLHEWVHSGLSVESGRKYVLRSDVFFEWNE